MGVDARGRHQSDLAMLLSMASIREWRTEGRNDSMILIILREFTVAKRNGMLIC